MYRVLIASFKHETNTFAGGITDIDCFRLRELVVGEQLIDYYKDTGTELGGFLTALATQPDIELLPVVAANAMPSGPVADAVAADIQTRVLAAIDANPRVNGVLLSLHGAMVTESSEDGEGDLMAAIRTKVGRDVPIIATLDLHSNFTRKMQESATALIHFDYYPHSDMYERGIEAGQLMLATLRGEVRPVMRYAKLPLLLASVTTLTQPMKRFVDLAHQYETDPGVISVSISHTFFCADIHELGVAVVAVTDGDAELAQSIADDIAAEIWSARPSLLRRLWAPHEALDEALATQLGPVVLSDGTDNPGGGSPCDGTHLLQAMIARGVEDAALALIYDPESVSAAERAGVGATVKLSLGGKSRPEILGLPIECSAYVRSLHDGRYVNKGAMGRGVTVDLLKSAVVVIGGIEVIVAANRTQPWDPEIFRAHGIEPREKRIIVLKSTVHFRANYEALAAKIIDVECPGLLPQDATALPYMKCRRPMYPLDPM